MDRLLDGRHFLLRARQGLLELVACFDQNSSAWLFFDRDGALVFRLAESGELIPMGRDLPGYSIGDLQEWAERQDSSAVPDVSAEASS